MNYPGKVAHNLRHLVKNGFWEPFIGSVYCIHSVCHKDPLVSGNIGKVNNAGKENSEQLEHLKLWGLQHK